MDMFAAIFRARRGTALVVGLCGCALLGFGQKRHSQRMPYDQPPNQIVPNRYTLVLSDPAVVERFADRTALASAQADSYRRQVDAAQAHVKSELAARKITVLGSISTLHNLVFVSATADRVPDLQSIPGVASVVPVRRLHVMLNRATALANAQQAWTAVGGQGSAGAGIKIAIIDTGIDQTHPALQDSSLSMPSGFPKGVTAFTTNKVIVARSYVGMLSSTDPTFSTPDDTTPRDRQGHGTFNAVVAAGVSTTTPALSTGGSPITISGMAPKAWLGNYKVEGSPGMNEFATDQALIQAVEDAVNDGMDVISCSVGGFAYSDAASDPLASAFEGATKVAVVVAAAGDDGSDSYYSGYSYPGLNTISTPSNAPDVISVGATLNSHVLQPTVTVTASSAPSSLKGIAAMVGDSYFYPSSFGSSSAPLVDITQIGDSTGLACNSLPAHSLDNSYALILRGTCSFDVKAANAQTAGAIGFVYYMADSSTTINPEGINEYGPAVMISNSAGTALKSYIDSNPGAVVSVDLNGMEQDITAWQSLNGANLGVTVAANQLASYSSMGPTPDGTLKPDMVAVGGFDVGLGPDINDPYVPAPGGMYSATQNYDPNQSYYANVFSANRYAAADGTSFATPMVAGAAAILKQLHPSLQPAQIRSLLVNYAAQNITLDDFGDQADAEWFGAGSLDAAASTTGTITAVPATVSFGILNNATLPITKTITLTNIGSGSANVSASVNCCTTNGSPSAKLSQIAVSPTSLTIAAGGTGTITVTFSGSKPAASEYSGSVVVTAGNSTLRIPFMAIEASGTAYNVLPLGGGEGAPGADLGTSYVQITDAYGAPVAGAVVTFSLDSSSPRGSLTMKGVSGEPACTPTSSTSSISCPSDQFGNAYVDVVAGSAESQPSVDFSVAGNSGLSGSFSYNVQTAPAITSVSDSAGGKSPVAPGSYVSIYGSNLSDFTDVNLGITDARAADGSYTVLPLQLDFVSVSFDVPSANISVPARIVYVSPTQVNIVVPWELQGQTSAQMKVVLDGDLFSSVTTVPLATYAPAFFTYGSNIAIAQDSGYNLITTTNPAKRGSLIVMYVNGLGPVSNQPATGDPASATAISQTTQPVTVSFGGTTATATFSGLTPGLQGLYQLNITVPSGATTGSAVPVTVSINGVTSAQATLPIQ